MATATGKPSSISGRVTFTVRWVPIATQLNAHALDALLPGVDLIAGRDFLNASHAVLDYGQGQCTLRSVAGCRTDLRASSQHGTSHPHWQVHPPAQSSPDRPCTAPERRCTAPAEQKLFGWLLPSAQTQILVPFRIGLSSRTENPFPPLRPCATCVSATALTWSWRTTSTPMHQKHTLQRHSHTPHLIGRLVRHTHAPERRYAVPTEHNPSWPGKPPAHPPPTIPSFCNGPNYCCAQYPAPLHSLHILKLHLIHAPERPSMGTVPAEAEHGYWIPYVLYLFH